VIDASVSAIPCRQPTVLVGKELVEEYGVDRHPVDAVLMVDGEVGHS
jgi:hypothetical protein